MKTSYPITGLALLVSIMLSTAAYTEPQSETSRQQITQAVSSGDVQSVIAFLPALNIMWPHAIKDYFQSADQVARFLGDAGDDPAVQQALDDLFAEVMNKRCPEDSGLVQATAYFGLKQNIIDYYYESGEISIDKPHLIAVSRFLGEIRDQRIPGYIYRRPGSEESVLREAGVSSASSLTNPAHIAAYEKAIKQNESIREMNGFQGILEVADRNVTSRLLRFCAQLRHDGKLDEDFANEVAENAHLTAEERK